MVDITPLKDYLEPLDKFHKEQIDQRVAHYGREYAYSKHLVWLDCTQTFKDGIRVIQTIEYKYVSEISQMYYLIKNYFKDCEDERLAELLEAHNKNIEYEKINPPIYYEKKKFKKRSFKQKDELKVKEHKQSAAERKLAAKVGKINALTFKVKKKE